MSGRGEKALEKKQKTRSSRAGLSFPVGRIHRKVKTKCQRLSLDIFVFQSTNVCYFLQLKKANYAERIGAGKHGFTLNVLAGAF